MMKVRARGPTIGPCQLSPGGPSEWLVVTWRDNFRNENCDEEGKFDEEETHRLTGHRTSLQDDGTRITVS